MTAPSTKPSANVDGLVRPSTGGMPTTDRAPLLDQIGVLTRRSVMRTVRQPKEFLPAIIFPLVLMAVLTGGLRTVVGLPGFPSDSYLDFILGAIFVQGAIINGINSGGGLALDIQSGFLRRLSLTQVQPTALLVAQLAGAVVVGLVQAVVFLAIGLMFGVTIESGLAGAVVIVVFTMLITMAFGGIGLLMALRTGSAEAVQGFAPALVFLMFLSSMLLPRLLVDNTWFRAVAAANPMSYLIDAPRSLIINHWNGVAIMKGFGVALGVTVLTISLSSGLFRTRMAMR